MRPGRALPLGIGVSLVVHGVLAVALRAGAPTFEIPEEEPAILVDFELPEAPEAEMPVADAELAAAPEPPSTPAAETEPESGGTFEALPEPEPEPEPEPVGDEVAEAAIDAGVSDAAPAVAEAFDAGVDDAATAVAEAETFDAGAEPVAAGPFDAGPELASATRPDPSAAGAGSDAGAGASEATESAEGGRSAGTHANLLAYVPPGELLSVVIRLDRLRGTEWARRAETVVEPMPDYRTLVGTRKVTVADLFDTLVVSSYAPTDVAATTLAARPHRPAGATRAFLDHPGAPVEWVAARGGALGKRKPGTLVFPGDPRVFLMPWPDWIVLTQPKHLGVLVEPGAGPVDDARAADGDLPGWLTRLRAIEGETGADSGPFLVLTTGAVKLPPDLPYVGTIPSPERATLAMELVKGGFYVRGTLLFDRDATAARFVEAASRAKQTVASSFVARKLLQRVHAYNAVSGLSFKQAGAKVGYATSIDVADGRAMMEYAATWARAFFGRAVTDR